MILLFLKYKNPIDTIVKESHRLFNTFWEYFLVYKSYD